MVRKKKTENTTSTTPKKYTYKDFVYMPDVTEDYEQDVYNVEHWIQLPSGNKIKADFTPYVVMSKIDFETYVDLECPKRMVQHRPMSSHDLRRWRGVLKPT